MENLNRISSIAKIVRENWKNIYFGAIPYLKAMEQIESIDQMYFEDTAADIVRRFLANATTWRGEVARTVKARLLQMLKE